MPDLPYLRDYHGHSLDDLLALRSAYRIGSLVHAVELQLHRRGGPYTSAERVVLSVGALEREVYNGGYDQFFFNSSVEHADSIVEALAAIECTQHAVIARRAIRALGVRSPIDQRVARVALARKDAARDATFEACDAAHYACDVDVAARLFEYVVSHRAEIRLP